MKVISKNNFRHNLIGVGKLLQRIWHLNTLMPLDGSGVLLVASLHLRLSVTSILGATRRRHISTSNQNHHAEIF